MRPLASVIGRVRLCDKADQDWIVASWDWRPALYRSTRRSRRFARTVLNGVTGLAPVDRMLCVALAGPPRGSVVRIYAFNLRVWSRDATYVTARSG